MSNQLQVKAGLIIEKPVHEVFKAIINPSQMKNYFISQGSGRMEEGNTVKWKFPELNMEFPVHVHKIKKDKYISFYWNDVYDKTKTSLEISLTSKEGSSTFVSINEKVVTITKPELNGLSEIQKVGLTSLPA